MTSCLEVQPRQAPAAANHDFGVSCSGDKFFCVTYTYVRELQDFRIPLRTAKTVMLKKKEKTCCHLQAKPILRSCVLTL